MPSTRSVYSRAKRKSRLNGSELLGKAAGMIAGTSSNSGASDGMSMLKQAASSMQNDSSTSDTGMLASDSPVSNPLPSPRMFARKRKLRR